MPRKKDGIPFVLHPRPTKGEDGKPLLYARPAPGHKLTQKEADKLCETLGGFRFHEFTRVSEVMVEVFSHYLAKGYTVETPFGSFAPKLKILGDYTNPQQVTSGSVRYAGIDFTPSQRFKREVSRHQHGCYRVDSPVGNAQMYDPKAMDRALRESMGTTGSTTLRAFCVCSGLKYKSARKYLDSLCQGDSPLLTCRTVGRTLLYVLNQ